MGFGCPAPREPLASAPMPQRLAGRAPPSAPPSPLETAGAARCQVDAIWGATSSDSAQSCPRFCERHRACRCEAKIQNMRQHNESRRYTRERMTATQTATYQTCNNEHHIAKLLRRNTRTHNHTNNKRHCTRQRTTRQADHCKLVHNKSTVQNSLPHWRYTTLKSHSLLKRA